MQKQLITILEETKNQLNEAASPKRWKKSASAYSGKRDV